MVPKKNCLIRRKQGHIGDLLMMTPSLEKFSENYEITLQVSEEYLEVFSNLRFIKKLVTFKDDLNNNEYDEIIDLSNFEFNYEQIHQPIINKTKLELFADALNVSLDRKTPIIVLSESEKIWVEEFIKNWGKDKIIVLAPISKNPSRDWSPEKWKALIDKLKETDYGIIVADKSLNWDDKEIVFFNNQSLRHLFALISKADLIITQDSGLLHMGAAWSIKTIVLFGPTDHKMRIYDNCYELHKNVGCYPCWYNRCTEAYCLKLIEIDEVYNLFKEATK